MTIQVKHYIELSDLTALRLVCNQCQATLVLPRSDHKLKQSDNYQGFLASCPGCHNAWTDAGGSTYEALIREATTALAVLRDKLESKTNAPSGLKLTFEVKTETGKELAKTPGTQI